MKNSFRRGFLLGVGLARMSTQKISKEVKSFAKQHNLTKQEADQLTKEFVHNFDKERAWVVSEFHRETKLLERKVRGAISKESKRAKSKARKIVSRAKKKFMRS